MNAPIAIRESLHDAHRRATDEANCWRGRVVNLFARGELIIAQALQAEADAKLLPMVLSQRITRLGLLIAGNEKKAKALDAFDQLTRDRNAIVHGSGRVYLDRDSQWLLTLHAIDRAGAIKRSINQPDAESKVRDLKVAIDRLSAAFRT